MLRALVLFVGVLLAAGIYVLVTGGPASAAPAAEPGGPRATDFGFALAAGAIALGATLMVTRPRSRIRR